MRVSTILYTSMIHVIFATWIVYKSRKTGVTVIQRLPNWKDVVSSLRPSAESTWFAQRLIESGFAPLFGTLKDVFFALISPLFFFWTFYSEFIFESWSRWTGSIRHCRKRSTKARFNWRKGSNGFQIIPADWKLTRKWLSWYRNFATTMFKSGRATVTWLLITATGSLQVGSNSNKICASIRNCTTFTPSFLFSFEKIASL